MTGTPWVFRYGILPGLIIFTLFLPAGAQGYLQGEYSVTGTGFLGDSGGYASPLNPENLAALKDLSLAHRLSTRFSFGDESASLEILMDLSPLSTPPEGRISPDLFNIALKRGAVSWYMGDRMKITLGRQSLLTGYGYGWNPLDLANPLKDPADPDAELTGVDGLVVHLLPGSPVNLKIYGLTEADISGSGVDYKDIRLGGEAALSWEGTELKVTAQYRVDQEESLSGPWGSLGAGIFSDLGGAGFYAETALRNRSRTLFVQEGGSLGTKSGPVWSALGGVEYTFPGGLFITAEYFYHGEGYNRLERGTIRTALEDPVLLEGLFSAKPEAAAEAAALFTALTGLYRPGYYSRHYGLLSLVYPLYDHNIDLTGALLCSLDSGSLALLPRVIWYISGSLALEAAYSGLFNLGDDETGEAALAPAKHTASLTGRFSF